MKENTYYAIKWTCIIFMVCLAIGLIYELIK